MDDLLCDCKRHGMTAPVLAVGDGALGFWKAVREVFSAAKRGSVGFTSRSMSLPHCRNQHARQCWQHVRRSTTPRYRQAQLAAKAFEADFVAKYSQGGRQDHPDGLDALLEFYRYPVGSG